MTNYPENYFFRLFFPIFVRHIDTAEKEIFFQMFFRTEVKVPKMQLQINHRQRNMLLGSCFAENIGKQLIDNKFDVEINPFGITYNPSSAAKILNMLMDEYEFTEPDILHEKDLYFTLMHHSDFSENDQKTYCDKIQAAAHQSAKRLANLDNLMVTFGTAYVYSWKETGEIVNNCHKLPASMFERKRLTVKGIVIQWADLISRLLSKREDMKCLFTVSPIRHWKDGAHDNQLSKSILLLAIDELQKAFPRNVFYFPSYEIVLDELRDYRFYAQDMIHPNETAIAYCWEKFSETFFDKETKSILAQWQPLWKAIRHRPLYIEGAEYQCFLNRTIDKLDKFTANYPFIDCKSEINQLKKLIIDNSVNS